MKLSIIIPAYNEEIYLPATLDAIEAAITGDVEIIVVDNESTDSTRALAVEHSATVVHENEHNIAKVRNTGAATAVGDVFVFIDADTIVRPDSLAKIREIMTNPLCVGGAAEVIYEPIEGRPLVQFFMKLWPVLGRLTRIRGGALQYCRAEIFRELDGYDPTIWVGEDIDFHWRLDKLAAERGRFTFLIDSPKVLTSSRRWQKMGFLRMIIFTHPVTIFLGWRVRSLWKDWYEDAVR